MNGVTVFVASIDPDKRGIHIMFLLFLHENICCGYSVEVPHRGTSNEYSQHMFSWRNKKKFSILRLKKKTTQKTKQKKTFYLEP